MKNNLPVFCKYAKNYSRGIGNTRKNNTFCSELATTRPMKELKAFFAFAEGLPTWVSFK